MTKNIDISDNLRVYEALEQLGINQKQAKVYLSLLKLGKSKVGPIAIHAQEKRTTTYHHLEYLKNKDLINETKSGKQTYYVARRPGVLRDLLNSQEKVVNYLIPKLSQISKETNLSKIEVFEGNDFIKIFNRILQVKEKRIYMLWREAIMREVRGKRFYFNKKRAEHGIYAHILYPRQTSKSIENMEETQKKYLAKIKLLPETIDLEMRVVLFDKSVAVISPHDGFSMIINNTNYYNLWLSIYKNLWEVSKGIK